SSSARMASPSLISIHPSLIARLPFRSWPTRGHPSADDRRLRHYAPAPLGCNRRGGTFAQTLRNCDCAGRGVGRITGGGHPCYGQDLAGGRSQLARGAFFAGKPPLRTCKQAAYLTCHNTALYTCVYTSKLTCVSPHGLRRTDAYAKPETGCLTQRLAETSEEWPTSFPLWAAKPRSPGAPASKGFVQEVMKGWLISSNPSAQQGDSTPWYASFWEFCARYCDARFGDE